MIVRSWFVDGVVGCVINENNPCVLFGGACMVCPSVVVTAIRSAVMSMWCFSVDSALRIEYTLNLSDGTCSTLSR